MHSEFPCLASVRLPCCAHLAKCKSCEIDATIASFSVQLDCAHQPVATHSFGFMFVFAVFLSRYSSSVETLWEPNAKHFSHLQSPVAQIRSCSRPGACINIHRWWPTSTNYGNVLLKGQTQSKRQYLCVTRSNSWVHVLFGMCTSAALDNERAAHSHSTCQNSTGNFAQHNQLIIPCARPCRWPRELGFFSSSPSSPSLVHWFIPSFLLFGWMAMCTLSNLSYVRNGDRYGECQQKPTTKNTTSLSAPVPSNSAHHFFFSPRRSSFSPSASLSSRSRLPHTHR